MSYFIYARKSRKDAELEALGMILWNATLLPC